MRRVLSWAVSVENVILIVTFIVMTLCVVVQVLNRNIFQLSMPWLEEIALYSMIYLVMFGVEAGLRDGSQIRVLVLRDRLRGQSRRMVELAVKIIITAFSIAMVFYSGRAVLTQMETGQTTPVLHLDMWVPYASFPVVFFIIAVVHIVGSVNLILRRDDVPEVDAQGPITEKGLPS